MNYVGFYLETNARKIPGVVAKLVHVLHRLHSVDTHGRHIPLRKSIVSALSIAITVGKRNNVFILSLN